MRRLFPIPAEHIDIAAAYAVNRPSHLRATKTSVASTGDADRGDPETLSTSLVDALAPNLR